MLLKKSSTLLTALLFTLVLLIQFSCKKTDSVTGPGTTLEPPVKADDAVKVTATITGTVIDENNKPVTGAAVTSGTYAATTDAMGNFVIKDAGISKANGNVTVFKSGYFKGIRSFVTNAGKNNYVKIQLIKQVVTGTVTASGGGVVNTLDGASITFPANAFVTQSGAAFSGTVFVYVKWIDPTAADLPLIMPGDLRGVDSTNGEYILKSYGMLGAELKDNSGNSLKIATGKTATVSFPIPSSLLATAPQSIPLWHFDETAARWKQEGTAVKNGNNYVGQVNKFSFWNVDVPGNFINLDVRLVNSANNLPLANTMIKITSLATNVSAYDFTNDSGYVSGYVPKNENLKLEVIASTICTGNTLVYTQNAGPFTANTSLGNINVILPPNQFINFTGIVQGCNNLPVTNGYISISLAGGNNLIAFTDINGTVNCSIAYCGGTTTYTYNAVDLTTINYSSITSGSTTTNSVNLNTITVCNNNNTISDVYIAGRIKNNAVLWKNGVPIYLTNYPPVSSNIKTAWATDVVVDNNDVYVLINVQSDPNGNVDAIKIWKNGVLSNVSNGTNPTQNGRSLDIYQGDIYVLGEEVTNFGANIEAKLWKNGISTATYSSGSVSQVKVYNGDVYVSGALGNSAPYKAMYWKNGVQNILPSVYNAGARGICINNGDIYVSGFEATVNTAITNPVVWKNGIKNILPTPIINRSAYCNSIYVVNNDVYVAGSLKYYLGYNTPSPIYWKNNTPVIHRIPTFADLNSETLDIFVKNDTVYSVGYKTNFISPYNFLPLYLKNSEEIQLNGFQTLFEDAEANSIFVK